MATDFDEYRGDVTYEVYRRGGDVDRIDDDRVADSYHEGLDAEEAAIRDLKRRWL